MLLTTYCSMSPKTPLKQRPSSPIVPINKGETTLYMYKIIAFKKFFVTGFRLVKQIHFLKGCFIIIILVLFYNVSKVYSEHAKYFFSWSKDGNHIYYIATDTFSRYDVWKLDTISKETNRLTNLNLKEDRFYDIFLDQNKVIYSNGLEIYLFDYKNNVLKKILSDRLIKFYSSNDPTSVSPDGKKYIFQSFKKDHSHDKIHCLDVAEGKLEDKTVHLLNDYIWLSEEGSLLSKLIWLSDKRLLLFNVIYSIGSPMECCLIDTKSKKIKKIFKQFGSGANLWFFVDSFRSKLYLTKADMYGDIYSEGIYSININTGVETLINDTKDLLILGGSPDGKKIAYKRYNGKTYEIVVTESDGKSLRSLDKTLPPLGNWYLGDYRQSLSFSSQGNYIAYAIKFIRNGVDFIRIVKLDSKKKYDIKNGKYFLFSPIDDRKIAVIQKDGIIRVLDLEKCW